jgi:hypothetical protein
MTTTLHKTEFRDKGKTFFGILIMLFVAALLISSKNFTEYHEQLNVTYQIKNIEKISGAEKYISAMNKANFNHYRLRSVRQVIRFEDGVEVELFSAEELRKNGIQSVIPSDFPEKWGPEKDFGTFRLAPNDFIIELKELKSPK